jgi:endo-beta-N-acetylglucosaminidase D
VFAWYPLVKKYRKNYRNIFLYNSLFLYLGIPINKQDMENMEEQVKWKMIEVLNWKRDHSYKRIKDELSVLEPDTVIELTQFVDKKVKELHKKYEAAWLGNDGGPGIDVGDDSWGDLIHDVVGRGETFYNSITTEKLREMADNYDFEESFCYCFL